MEALPVPLEHAEQSAFVRWFRLQFPGVLIHSIPNGAYLNGTSKQRASQMWRLKAEGLVEGVPDLHVPAWNLWIEMKRTNGSRLSRAQKDMHESLRKLGDRVIVGKGWEDAKNTLLDMILLGEGLE